MRGRGIASFVVGTAGHIDHGKSALVKALTSIDPDRLDEEKRRGMTIDLGFAYLDLPSGRRIAIVDVPGHQRFLKNMLAGVHGMDAVLFVIAADEGPMPQTKEHLAIIDLLQIKTGVVVLTKADLVDEAWLSLVRDDVSHLLEGTTLSAAPMVAVSSATGQGLNELRAALDAELEATTGRADLGRPRLPIDRSFAMPGFGTVVTGTLVGGSLRQGAEMVLLPSERPARIRGLQQHNTTVQEAHPGTRTAVNLSGIDHSKVERGEVLTLVGSLMSSRRLDVRLTMLAGATEPIRHRQRLLMYHGTAERMVEVSLLDDDELRPGYEGLAQLYAAVPIPGVDGDRFILRRPSPPETVAGGVILDMAPRRHRRRDTNVLSSLGRRLDANLSTRVVVELQKHLFGLSLQRLAARLSVDEITLDSLSPSPGLVRMGAIWMTAGYWERIAARIHDALESYHRAQPLRKGMPRQELRSKAGLPADLFSAAIARLIGEGIVAERGTDVALASHKQGLTAEQENAMGRFLAELELQRFNPPPLGELMQRHQVTPALVQYLVAEQRIVRVSDDTVFIRAAYDEALSRLRTHLEEHRTLTVAAARDVLGSSRRYVLPLLEWLDAQKITRRVGDDRILRG